MGILFPAYGAVWPVAGAPDDGEEDGEWDGSGPLPGNPHDRALEILARLLDQHWNTVEILQGTEDDEQLLKWLLNAVAYGAHDAARAIAQRQSRRLPSFRRRHR